MIGLALMAAAIFAAIFALLKAETSKTRILAAAGILLSGASQGIPRMISTTNAGMLNIIAWGLLAAGLAVSLWAYNNARVEAMSAAIGE